MRQIGKNTTQQLVTGATLSGGENRLEKANFDAKPAQQLTDGTKYSEEFNSKPNFRNDSNSIHPGHQFL